MRTVSDWLTPVRFWGMAAYLIAGCISFWGLMRSRQKLAAVAGIVNLLMFLDIAFDWRWKLYDLIKNQALAHQVYEMRRGPQLVALLLLFVVFACSWRIASLRLRKVRGSGLVLLGILLTVAVWCAEVISLHAVDAFLYQYVGKWMVIDFIWVCIAALSAMGSLRMGSAISRMEEDRSQDGPGTECS